MINVWSSEVTGDKASAAPLAPSKDNAEQTLSRAQRQGERQNTGGNLHAYGHNEILSPIKHYNQLPHPCRTRGGLEREDRGHNMT